MADYMDSYRLKTPVEPGGAGVGDYLSSIKTDGTKAGASSGNPYIAGAGVVSDVIGSGFNIYNQYQQREQQQKAYEQALKEYEEAKARQQEIDQINMQQMQLANTFTGGEYANKLRQQDAQSGQFYSDIGR